MSQKMENTSYEVFLNCKEQNLLDYIVEAYMEITSHNLSLDDLIVYGRLEISYGADNFAYIKPMSSEERIDLIDLIKGFDGKKIKITVENFS